MANPLFINNKYMLSLDKKIGAGAFGEVYVGTDMKTKEQVAMKLERRKKNKDPRLLRLVYEKKYYKLVQGGKGIPKFLWYGVEGDYNILVMEKLGSNLHNIFKSCGGEFSLKTVLMLAIQMISRVEFLHSQLVLHRDIKPDNFVMGMGGCAKRVYIIDFGVSKKYKSTSKAKKKQHIPYREERPLIGTPRYCSLNAHLGIELSRRDDLEAIGYVLMYFLRGSLPWQDIEAERGQKYKKIGELKKATSIEALCGGYPTEFATYFHYCRGLKFEDEPDYSHLKKLFRGLLQREGFQYDHVFDWNITNSQRSQVANAMILGPSAEKCCATKQPSILNNADQQSGEKEGRSTGLSRSCQAINLTSHCSINDGSNNHKCTLKCLVNLKLHLDEGKAHLLHPVPRVS